MTDLRYVVAPIALVDVRDNQAQDTWTMSGYAAVFDQRTTLYDGKFLKITEDIAPEAFNAVMRDQPMGEPGGVVHFNLGHDMNRAVAATDVTAGQPGSLKLSVDKQGLRFMAKVSRDDPDGIAMAAKMRSGVIKQASFAFTIGSMETVEIQNEDGPDEFRDRITGVKHLYDVCACAQGAYSQTVSGLRSYAAMLGQLSEERDQPRHSTVEAGSVVSPDRLGDAVDITPPRPSPVAERAALLLPIRVDFTGKDRDVRNNGQDAGDPDIQRAR